MALIIGHRGASGYRPEHTLASYRLAIELGADFIEPDVVATRDGELVCRHEPEISSTTDVASRARFADRRTTKTIDGAPWTGWFTDDFTLEELRTLRAVERLPEVRPDNTAFDGQEPIPTFDEVVALARSAGVGLYPETKHPTYFRSTGRPLEERLLEVLEGAGYSEPADPVFLQSFERGNLRMLRSMTGLRLVQLVAGARSEFYDPADRGDPRAYDDLLTPAGLEEVAGYADGIGPAKTLVVPRDEHGSSLAPTTVVADAHAAGLVVHPWTFRRESVFVPADLDDLAAELELFFDVGVDGVFTDNPDVAVAVRDRRLRARA